MKLVLASGSPRRKELLTQAGYEFEVLVSEAEEDITEAEPTALVEELAVRKARAVARQYAAEEALIIGADTIVVLDGRILGKPKDAQDAKRMITALQGRDHQVYTGVALVVVEEDGITDIQKFHERTDVTVRAMTEEEIRDYIENSDEWKDKAGAYGIQTFFGAKYIPSIHGDYYNVVGFPVCAAAERIEQIRCMRKK